MNCDVLIVGGGTGGTAALLALAGSGLRVVLCEETRWLGGQLTSQLVPPDEHRWIESTGCTRTYREFRNRVRGRLGGIPNPGGGWVSRLCHDPRAGVAVIAEMIAESGSDAMILMGHRPSDLWVAPDGRVAKVALVGPGGHRTLVWPKYLLDATETGDAVALAGCDHRIGAEGQDETGEPHALPGLGRTDAVQGFTWCAALGHDPDGENRSEPPPDYRFWRDHVPSSWTGRLLSLTFPNVRTGTPMELPVFPEEPGQPSLFTYRQIIDPAVQSDEPEPVTCLNWPQNDYWLGPVLGADPGLAQERLCHARSLTMSVVHWLREELGWVGLRLRPDVAGTPDGLAMAPYHRESRRIVGHTTMSEHDVTGPGRRFRTDSVGVGQYRIDLHPRADGSPTVDIAAQPFQIPLGCLVPGSTPNVIAAGKCLSVTHVANGCFRVHPVEWNVGEAAGRLAGFCLEKSVEPQDVASGPALLKEFQDRIVRAGVQITWPEGLEALDPDVLG
ncbi:MAG: FAD-dependent oxidoreductase [Fimbriimonadaceae bacterium]|nr:FAD-dependent oxidoreductase [Fimbriimonadaceae bacterium]QYK57990.1 MAG: FAD-dependent oxidoreductase [Fimbriimonadaceae bacterium]